jgi:hypothetical protein
LLSSKFGQKVAILVQINSYDESFKGEEKVIKLMGNIVEQGSEAIIIKCADILVNFNYYKDIGDEKKKKSMKYFARLLIWKAQEKGLEENLLGLLKSEMNL